MRRSILSGSARGRIPWLGLSLALLPCSICPAAVIHMGAQQIPFTWEVVPAVVRPGEPYTIRVSRFSSREYVCDLLIGRDKRKVPCGSKEVSLSLTAPLDSWRASRITLIVCMPVRDKHYQFECGGPVETLQLKVQGETPPAAPAMAPASAPPASAGPVPLLRPPEAQPPAARDIPRQPAPRPPDDSAGRRKLRVRSLDGRMRDRELPPDQAERARQRKRFQLALLHDDAVRAAYDGWAGLDDEARRQALARVVALHSQAYGIDPPELVFRKLPGRVRGLFKQGGDTLYINDNMRGWDDPDQAFGVVVHEDAHHRQQELIKRLDSGSLKPGDEGFEEARKWKANMADYCSPNNTGKKRQCGYDEYRSQPVERDANEEGQSATRSLRSQDARDALAEQQGERR